MFAIRYSTGIISARRFEHFSDAERFAQSEAAILRATVEVVEAVFGHWSPVGVYAG